MPASLFHASRFRIAFGIWWLCWSALHFAVLYTAGFSGEAALYDSLISNLLLAAVVVLVTLTLQYYLPDQNKYSYLFGLSIALSFLWLAVTRAMLNLLLQDGNEYDYFFSRSLLIRGATGFLVISCMTLISTLWYTLQDRQETERRRAEMDKLARDAELNNLRQQLQPHFLFNSLNSINALVGSQPQKARKMILQLSEFLRGTLKKEQTQWITLNEELQHLELYLEIEKVRFGHRLATRIISEGENARLPVMILQPLVENAIKFGVYDTMEAIEITIHTRVEDGYLYIYVKNPYDRETSSPRKGTGFGLSSVQRRLFLLFARTDLLGTATEENFFITTIKIPQQ